MIDILRIKKLFNLLTNFNKYISPQTDLIFYIKIEQLINLSNEIIKINFNPTSFDKFITDIIIFLNEALLKMKHFDTDVTIDCLDIIDNYFICLDKLNYIIKKYDDI